MVTLVRRLAEREKLSAGEIAKAIGFNTTRNMVMGIVDRSRPKIVLPGPRHGGRPKQSRARTKPAAPRSSDLPAPLPAPPAKRPQFFIVEEVGGAVHFDALRSGDHRCRYPLWPDRVGTKIKARPTELYYCGKPVLPGSSWCEACYAKVFMPPMAAKVAPGKGRRVDAAGRRVGWQYGT